MGLSVSKYPAWGELLKKKRFEKFRSAREFCSKLKVGISYPQYSRYESGDQLPNLDQAVRLCDLLHIPVLEGVLEWCLTQMNHSSAREELQAFVKQLKIDRLNRDKEIQDKARVQGIVEKREGSKVSLDEVIVFNRSHMKLFSSHPAYRDIFTYVNSFAPDWINLKELSEAVEVELPEVEKMVDQLSDLGVLLVAGGRCRSAKKTFYFPDDAEFFELRNSNMKWNVEKVLERLRPEKVQTREAFRAVISREFTSDQIKQILGSMEKLVDDVIQMPETQQPETVYSLCLLLGDRFKRKVDQADRKG